MLHGRGHLLCVVEDRLVGIMRVHRVLGELARRNDKHLRRIVVQVAGIHRKPPGYNELELPCATVPQRINARHPTARTVHS